MSDKNKTPQESAAEVLKAQEAFKTVRYFIVGAVICFCAWMIHRCVLAWLDKPPWLEVVEIIVAALGGPSGLFALYIFKVKRYTTRMGRRNTELETKLDPGRTTSGLLPDGTNRKEDHL